MHSVILHTHTSPMNSPTQQFILLISQQKKIFLSPCGYYQDAIDSEKGNVTKRDSKVRAITMSCASVYGGLIFLLPHILGGTIIYHYLRYINGMQMSLLIEMEHNLVQFVQNKISCKWKSDVHSNKKSSYQEFGFLYSDFKEINILHFKLFFNQFRL